MDPKYTLAVKTFLQANGSLNIIGWAINAGSDEHHQLLSVDLSERNTHLENSVAKGEALISNGKLGADIIRLKAGQRFLPHTHPGDHLILTIGGKGTVTYNGKIYQTDAGQIYLIEGKVPHAVGAITDHLILAIGSPHKPIDAYDRMTPVEYITVTSEVNSLNCLICGVTAVVPQFLHHFNCHHCPCTDCVAKANGAEEKTQL